MKRRLSRLKLSKETLRRLDHQALVQAQGGTIILTLITYYMECTQHTCESGCPTMCAGGGFSCGRRCGLDEEPLPD